MHGCGWDSGAARERSSALAASVASRYALGADGVGAAQGSAAGKSSAPTSPARGRWSLPDTDPRKSRRKLVIAGRGGPSRPRRPDRKR